MSHPLARFGARGPRKVNPETLLTRQVRDVLRILMIPHRKVWGGPMSDKGLPDLIGTVPGTGRAFFCELKIPGNRPSPEQRTFLEEHKAAGALAFWADSVVGVVNALKEAGYTPAARLGLP